MPTFRDSKGRDWTIDPITVGQVKRLKASLGLDLVDDTEGSISRLTTSPMLLADTLWFFVQHHAGRQHVDEQSFAEGLAGDQMDLAAAALLAAVVDFFPQRQRPALRAAIQKHGEWVERAAAMAIERMNEPGFEKRMLEQIAGRMDGALSGAWPPSPASTPSP